MDEIVSDARAGKTKKRWLWPVLTVLAFAFVGSTTLFVTAATTTASLWPTRTIPGTITSSDAKNVEVGVKFRANVAGQVTAIRFYKGAQNTGVHTGSLWDDKGNLLATVTFKNESLSGWQTASLAQPIVIAANVTYTVSYHAPKGHYSYNYNYFNTVHTKGNLTALANTTTSGNGVYAYSSSVAYPQQSYKATNYWVDLVFKTHLIGGSAKPAPPVSVQAAQSGTAIVVNWPASISAKPISSYSVLRNGSKVASVAGNVYTYTDKALTAGTTYAYQIQAVDNGGAISDASPTASATYNVIPVPAPVPVPVPVPVPTPTPAPTPTPSTGRPDATNTGPTSATLSAWAGSTSGYDSTSNMTYDSIKLPTPSAGYWTFTGSNLTFKNCIIGGGVVFRGTNIRVEHCDIPGGVSLSGTSNVTMLYNNIHDFDDGIHITSDTGPVSNVTISYNYVHAPAPSCGNHSDAIQLLGVNGLTVTYNTLNMGTWFQVCNQDALNSAFQIESTQGLDTNMNLSYNYLNGGGYTARFYACASTTFAGNRFGRDYHYGPVVNQDNACFLDKSGNVWDDSGQALTF
jgi:hypothetical protein